MLDSPYFLERLFYTVGEAARAQADFDGWYRLQDGARFGVEPRFGDRTRWVRSRFNDFQALEKKYNPSAYAQKKAEKHEAASHIFHIRQYNIYLQDPEGWMKRRA